MRTAIQESPRAGTGKSATQVRVYPVAGTPGASVNLEFVIERPSEHGVRRG